MFIQGLETAGNLERARQAGHDVTVSLPVEFDLPGFVLNQLSLITSLDGAQFVRAATGQQHARQSQRQKADKQQDAQDNV